MTADPNSPHIGLVVEGPGDRDAIPLLLRAHLEHQDVYEDCLGKPVPCRGRGSATVPGGIEGYVAATAARPGCRGVMIILDSDDDLVCELGPQLYDRAHAVSRVPVSLTLADRCFEDWIYSSAETLKLGIAEYQENRRGLIEIKQALGQEKYVKPVWQPRLTSRMDIGMARARSVSLDRFLKKFDSMREYL